MRVIDINADVGEGSGFDAALMRSITSASVCAGYHAGGPSVTAAAVGLAKAHGVAIGVHPGFRDRDGFGRRELGVSPTEIESLVASQIAIITEAAEAQGARVGHVKPHGALYNMAVRDRGLADAIARAVASFDSSLVLFGLAGSVMLDAGREAGLTVAAEGFADRSYEPDGSLTPRSRPGAVLHDPAAVAARAVHMVRNGRVKASDGREVPLHIDTICVHGDTPGADASARELRKALTAAGITVRAVGAKS
jgi:UPF0271 protein